MVKIDKYIFLVILTVVVLGFGTAQAQQELAQAAYTIFQKNCLGCHGEHGAFTEDLIIEHTALIAGGTVVPRNPNASEFYKRLIEDTPEKPRMPWGSPPLSQEERSTIWLWIQAGAPDWEVQYDVNFISTETVLDTIQGHLKALSAFDRPFARYFTLTHLYNAGESPEALRAYRIALSKLVNSLSWGFEVINPTPIDAAETVFYIDLRHYEWDVRNEAWTQIEREYPYSIDFDPETQAGLQEKMAYLRSEMECEVPFVYVDWFLANASLPPLYHDILDLPETDRELEQQLEVDVPGNIENAPGVRVWRAGMNESGVSNHNRVVERHTSRYGAYWKSYDFAGSVGTQNIFTHPLSFQQDGGEVVFNLPNGLQGYYISDASGNRIDEAPTDIVSNPSASNPAVRNGLSCIGCHTEGMKTFEDVVRAVIMREPEGAAKSHGLRLYVEQSVMDALVAEDTERYREALEATGGVFGGIEPVHRFHEEFHVPVDAAHAAAAVGLETEAFLQEIRDKQSLRGLGLSALTREGGNVKRDAWTSNFREVISLLNSPDDTGTPTVDPGVDLRPGDLVTIPDPNLRAAIESALGKAPRALITAGDMARLTQLVADNADINDLRGLEAATQLERIEFRHNSISDLSPLRGLTRLNNIKLRGNRIRDVSPLAGLVNVGWLGLEENEIRDLSPLKGLIKLNGIGISGNPISDISPLSNLRNLEGIDAWRTLISDFSPLAELPRFRWIEFGDDKRINVLPSLKGLKSLRRLVINRTSISDISGLAALTQLQSLTLDGNLISDISPLASLKSLTYLNLNHNVISNISSLAGLKELKELQLYANVISDISPLAGLTNLERLELRRNAISDFSPLDGLTEKTFVTAQDNLRPFLRGGPKIVGPWLWVVLPGEGFHNGKDLLSQASGGKVTELGVATQGATVGEPVGNSVWTSHKINPNGYNTPKLVSALGVDESQQHRVIYGSIILHSHSEQQTTMFAGSDDFHKVWLNGKLVNEEDRAWHGDYEVSFPVTLKQGKNVLLVAVSDHQGGWSGSAHFGFAPDTEYTVLPPGARFSLSTASRAVEVGDRFTVQLKAEDLSDLAGWQGDLIFDPAVLRVNSVSEGNFLKQRSGRTHFLKGTIDNTAGKISDIGSARISGGGASGEGTLLSVSFTAKANGESRLGLRKFQAGSSSGETISVLPPDIVIKVGAPSVSVVGDTEFFSLSTAPASVRVGETFDLRLSAENVTDLAGWETAIAFDPAVLEAVEVSEGDFLKVNIGDTFFLRGTIDNTAGKITGISTAKLNGSSNGTGILLSVTFRAKAGGQTRVTFSDFSAGSSSGKAISSGSPEIVFTIETGAFLASDVNRDGQVNVLDLILVAQHLGKNASANPQADINGDGTINVLDLIIVAQHLGESSAPAAPSNPTIETLVLDAATIRAWLVQAAVEDDGSLAFRAGIENLRRLLASVVPDKTALLANYPNPFNPETWIPYHLSAAADVTVRIYTAGGALVRTLALGHRVAGLYESRVRAVYWDGKNEVGEPVASGVYFYMLTAGDFSATRKMLIRK